MFEALYEKLQIVELFYEKRKLPIPNILETLYYSIFFSDIFRAIKPYGTFAAVLLTYVTSSLLHGLNFQLWATLLTIGVWSYVEYNMRNKLAQIFSACVLVNKCTKTCTKHHLGHNKLLTLFINVIFSVMCIINLAYLGAIFDASSQLQTEGFSFKHTLDKWYKLDYISHWLLLLGYIFNWII